MCALCGILGGAEHWADAHPRPGAFTRNIGPLERRRERVRRVDQANSLLRPLGLTLSDWQGSAFLLGPDAPDDPNGLLYYLGRVFESTPQRTVRVVANPAAPDPKVAPGLIVVASELAPDRAAEVRRRIEAGASALVVATRAGESPTLAALLGVPRVEWADAPAGRDAMLGEVAFDHPLFAPLAGPQFNDFTKIRFWKHRVATDPGPPLAGARVVARFDDNSPAIVEKPAGRGRIVVFTSGWNPADSQLARSSKFVPLMASLLDRRGAASGDPKRYQVGDRVPLVDLGFPAERTGAVEVRQPDGKVVPLEPGTGAFAATDAPGVYSARAVGPDAGPPRLFAVNLDPSESRTAPLGRETLQQLGAKFAGDAAREQLNAETLRQMQTAELEGRQKFWRWLVLGAIALLLGETWLAGRVDRTRNTPPARSDGDHDRDDEPRTANRPRPRRQSHRESAPKCPRQPGATLPGALPRPRARDAEAGCPVAPRIVLLDLFRPGVAPDPLGKVAGAEPAEGQPQARRADRGEVPRTQLPVAHRDRGGCQAAPGSGDRVSAECRDPRGPGTSGRARLDPGDPRPATPAGPPRPIRALRPHGGPGLETTPAAPRVNSPRRSRLPSPRAAPTRPMSASSRGDAEVEQGSPLLVVARFANTVPGSARLEVEGTKELTAPIGMARSLEDPTFAGRVEAVERDLTYRVAFDGGSSPTYRVKVFTFPAVRKVDAHLAYPAYTGLESKTLADVRHVTAVEGTTLGLSVKLNKEVAQARLVDEKGQGTPLVLVAGSTATTPEGETEATYQASWVLAESHKYKVELVDRDGRKNKGTTTLNVNVTVNRPATVAVTAPGRDTRVSPVEELRLQAKTEDDFGVVAHGVNFTSPGGEPVDLALDPGSPAAKKRVADHMIALEDLKAQPDQLISYYFWADDIGPDGEKRRTSGDIFFAEVRHFEEIFRQGEAPPESGAGRAATAAAARRWPAGREARRVAEAGHRRDLDAHPPRNGPGTKRRFRRGRRGRA